MALPRLKWTLDDYLAWENEQPDRTEFNRGCVLPMGDISRVHALVVGNLVRRLGNHLDDSPCQVFGGSAKLQIANDAVFYPDLFVTCNRADLATEMIFRAPTLLIEVLSPSTQAYDRSQKFAVYRQLASLKEYILVDPDTRRVEAFRREADDRWLFHDMSQDEAMSCTSVGCTVPLAQVFQDIDPEA